MISFTVADLEMPHEPFSSLRLRAHKMLRAAGYAAPLKKVRSMRLLLSTQSFF